MIAPYAVLRAGRFLWDRAAMGRRSSKFLRACEREAPREGPVVHSNLGKRRRGGAQGPGRARRRSHTRKNLQELAPRAAREGQNPAEIPQPLIEGVPHSRLNPL